ncbi:ribonuclease HII [Litchfieldia alkalitelluris]|uniref:ribonuclease HII n=1 Tax=Litchfieldia alkalitelluris TaxID=304268 RepID=UPI000998815A|nr:ribonuclease HII [Litchfieldia alkalitelluris]
MDKSIKEISEELAKITDENHSLLKQLKNDTRKGVQQLLAKWKKIQQEKRNDKELFIQMSQFEENLYSNGVKYIAGIDEVGRGPLAGPVIAAAVILPRDFYLPGLNDSKKLTELKREQLYVEIAQSALSIGVGIIDANKIDEVNIYQATKLAMKQAILKLSIKPDHLLIDAMQLSIQIPQTSIIKGDSKSYSIAASSIIAKVTRDRLMKRLGMEYPQYGFEQNMGYGTSLHLEALQNYGVTDHHRRSFAPVREALTQDLA